LGLISKRASGRLWTMARYIRHYLQKHPDYKEDSIVSQQINYDLLKHLDEISVGKVEAPELYGDFSVIRSTCFD
jgi:glutamate--cysteine ligase catalytic subunit